MCPPDASLALSPLRMGRATAARAQAKTMMADNCIVNAGLKTKGRVGKECDGWVEWKERVEKVRRTKSYG